MSEPEIYARRLLVKRYGYPLWVPHPYGQPEVYNRKGVRIGDVGYVTQDGGFHALFNIRAPSERPTINWQGVPNGFRQFPLEPQGISHIQDSHSPGSVITSTAAVRRSLDVGVSTAPVQTMVSAGGSAEYSWSSTEGAILHLPQGASRINATLTRTFREEAIAHAENWYVFAWEHSDISNGALYLITGCDKTNSWMVGAFSESASGSNVALRLNALNGIVEGQISYSYSWTESSPATFRVGPPGEGTAASDVDPEDLQRDDEIFTMDAPQGRNQCTFLRGFRIKLREALWHRILGVHAPELSDIKDVTGKDIKRNLPTYTAPAALRKGRAKASGDGPVKAPGDGQDSIGVWNEEHGDDPPSYKGDVNLQDIPGIFEDCHPATSINNFMLEKYPDASVAITHDDDWMCLINEEDELCPNTDELWLRLQRSHTFDLIDNAVMPVSRPHLLNTSSQNTPSEDISLAAGQASKEKLNKAIRETSVHSDSTLQSILEGHGLISFVSYGTILAFQVDEPLSQELAAVMKSLDNLMEIPGLTTPLSTYITIAWKAVLSVSRVVKHQPDENQEMQGLFKAMTLLYEIYVQATKNNTEINNTLIEGMKQVLNQTIECMIFIQEYIGKGFAGQHVSPHIKGKVKVFRNTFNDLGYTPKKALGVKTNLVSLRVFSHVPHVQELALQKALNPAVMNWSGRTTCHPQTQLDVLHTITEWIIEPPSISPSKVLWITGLAHTGKSTATTTLAKVFADVGRLGAYVFFDHDTVKQSGPSKFIVTLAYTLSRFDMRIARHVEKSIKRNPSFAEAGLESQFRELVKKPLQRAVLSERESLSDEGPVVIVIDALDECGSKSDQNQLFKILATETSQLPPVFRIIITSRPDPEIQKSFNGQAHIKQYKLDASLDDKEVCV